MIRIVTDSSADLPAELAALHRVEVVPLSVRFGLDDPADRGETGSDAFWERLASSPTLPETFAPSAGSFLEAFRRLRDEGADGVVTICLSSALSAAYQSAVIAAEKAADEVPVRVVDSRTVSMGIGLQVLEAAEVAESGAGLEEVAAAALAAAASTNILAALDTLEYLERGGRLGKLEGLLGRLLDVKPIITFADGVMTPVGRVRTRARARAAVAAKAAEVGPRLHRVAVLHGRSPDVDEFVEQVRAGAPGVEPIVASLGPVVATHSGPGVLGLAYHLG